MAKNSYHKKMTELQKHIIREVASILENLSEIERWSILDEYPNAGVQYGDSEGALDVIPYLKYKTPLVSLLTVDPHFGLDRICDATPERLQVLKARITGALRLMQAQPPRRNEYLRGVMEMQIVNAQRWILIIDAELEQVKES